MGRQVGFFAPTYLLDNSISGFFVQSLFPTQSFSYAILVCYNGFEVCHGNDFHKDFAGRDSLR